MAIFENTRHLLLATGLLACLAACQAPADERVTAAEQAARAWLADVDSGRYDDSWHNAATLFKRQVGVEQWRGAVSGVRKPLGNIQSRDVKSATFATSLPGAPDGEYVVLQFETVFDNKASAIETVTPMLEDGEWRVSGYFVN